MKKFVKVKLASLLGVVGNSILFVLKFAIGLLTNSYAMMADAYNSLTDIVTSIITYVGARISSKPRDADHNFGHGKAEYIYSMIISIIMFLLSLNLISSSLETFITPVDYKFSPLLFVGGSITILVKATLYFYTIRIAKTYDNLLIKANAIDHRNDCVLTILNMASSVAAYYGIFVFDGLVALLIALWIFASAFQIFKKSYDILMDKAIEEKTKEKIIGIINAHPEIENFDHFYSSPIGYLYQISLTIFVDGRLSTYDSHEIANSLEKEISTKVPEVFITTIHVNPQIEE